jgi:hypothetical protein
MRAERGVCESYRADGTKPKKNKTKNKKGISCVLSTLVTECAEKNEIQSRWNE